MRVLIAVDGGPSSQEVMEAVAHLVQASDEVHVCSVVDAGVARDTYRAPAVDTRGQYVTATGQIMPAVQLRPPPVETAGQATQRAVGERRAHLEALSHRVPGAPRWQIHVEVGADPGEAILRQARQLAVHGIAMGTRARGSVAQALLGSVAEHVIRHSDVPVLVVRDGLDVPGPLPEENSAR